MTKSQYWCFTLNNYNENEVETLQNLCSNEAIITYCTFGREVGEDNGTRHLQGYLELSRRFRFIQVKRLLGERYHLEKRRGTADQAAEYCHKDDASPYIYGEISLSQQGKRNDLEALHASLREKKDLVTISDDHFSCFIKYERSIKSYITLRVPERNHPPNVIVYWGLTGTGKTRSIYDNLPNLESLFLYPGSGWFDGYYGQPICLFDDFSGSEFKIAYLLKLLDRYPIKVPIKGSFVHWYPSEIYITSNLDPRHWYRGAHPEHVEALFRRFTNIIHFQ